jgi:hypothetical protein
MKAQLRHLRDEVLRDIRGPIYLVIGGHHSNVVVSQLLLDALAGVADGEEELVIPEPLDTATIPSHVIQGL